MKNSIYLLLSLSIILFSCKTRKNKKEEEAAKTEVVEVKKEKGVKDSRFSQKEDKAELIEDKIEIEEADRENSAIISLSKSICFGVCPAFTFQVFKDGSVLYEGTENVKRKGKFKGKLTSKQINTALKSISDIGYFLLNNSYDNENVSDLPTAMTFVNYEGKRKKVICRFDCDERITKVNILIEELIELSGLEKK